MIAKIRAVNIPLLPGSRRDLNAPAIRLINFSIAGAFESNLLGRPSLRL